MNTETLIRKMSKEDVSAVASIHAAAFPRQLHSVEWVTCNLPACPRIQCFVATVGGDVVGFIQWTQRSGFREKVVLEAYNNQHRTHSVLARAYAG